jgi:pimeloyl-ACP methyl ester carboxylesterase
VTGEAYATVDGLNVRYLEAGAGPAVIFMHGASTGSSSEVFETAIAQLAEAGYRAIAYDHPGYGLTDNPSNYATSYRVRFITKLMDALGIDKATLVGHSQSGLFAVQTALEQPSRVAGVAIVGTGPLLPPLPDAAPAARVHQPAVNAAPPDERGDPTLDDIRKQLEADTFHKDLITDEVVQRRHRLSVGKNVIAATERSKAREPRQEGKAPHETLTDITQPLVLLYGDKDRASAGKRAALLKEQQPGLDVRIVRDAAHMLMWDAPDDLRVGLLDLLQRVRQRSTQPASV